MLPRENVLVLHYRWSGTGFLHLYNLLQSNQNMQTIFPSSILQNCDSSLLPSLSIIYEEELIGIQYFKILYYPDDFPHESDVDVFLSSQMVFFHCLLLDELLIQNLDYRSRIIKNYAICNLIFTILD